MNLKDACKFKSEEANFLFGQFLQRGIGITNSKHSSFEKLIEAAVSGHINTEWKATLFYLNGEGCTTGHAELRVRFLLYLSRGAAWLPSILGICTAMTTEPLTTHIEPLIIQMRALRLVIVLLCIGLVSVMAVLFFLILISIKHSFLLLMLCRYPTTTLPSVLQFNAYFHPSIRICRLHGGVQLGRYIGQNEVCAWVGKQL